MFNRVKRESVNSPTHIRGDRLPPTIAQADDPHCPRTSLIAIENTQNMCFGAALPGGFTPAVAELCRSTGLALHVDGARLISAAAATGMRPRDLVAGADSVSLCLSKSLSCPVGSLLLGGEEFIRRARRMRKAMGGGMRQSGVLAAAGLVALKDEEALVAGACRDNATAASMRAALAAVDGISVVTEDDVFGGSGDGTGSAGASGGSFTNMVYFGVEEDAGSHSGPGRRYDDAWLVSFAQERGVFIKSGYDTGEDRPSIRAVLHRYVDAGAAERAVEVVKEAMESRK